MPEVSAESKRMLTPSIKTDYEHKESFFWGGGGSKFSSKLKVKNYHSMYFINGHTHLKTP